MADWTYQIIDQSGKERKGNIVAESEAEAKNKLKMDGNKVSREIVQVMLILI